jgi:hypothetical protein
MSALSPMRTLTPVGKHKADKDGVILRDIPTTLSREHYAGQAKLLGTSMVGDVVKWNLPLLEFV